MLLHPRVAQLLAAVLLWAAWLAPSPASAHAGHAHHAPAPATIEAAVTPSSAQQADMAPAATARTARAEIARAATVQPAEGGNDGCASHCCGGAAGMTCCTAALVPEMTVEPALAGAGRLLFARSGALLGLPPEALPKPPKSFV